MVRMAYRWHIRRSTRRPLQDPRIRYIPLKWVACFRQPLTRRTWQRLLYWTPRFFRYKLRWVSGVSLLILRLLSLDGSGDEGIA